MKIAVFVSGRGSNLNAILNYPDLKNKIYLNPGESGVKSNNGIDDDNNGFIDDYTVSYTHLKKN